MEVKTAEFPLSIPEELKDFITKRAKKRGIPRNSLITKLKMNKKIDNVSSPNHNII